MSKPGPKKKRISVNGTHALRTGSALIALVAHRALLYEARRANINRFDLILLIAINELKQAANELPGECDVCLAVGTTGGNIRRALSALRANGYVISLGTYGMVYQCTAAGIAIVESFEHALEEEKIRLYKLWNGKK